MDAIRSAADKKPVSWLDERAKNLLEAAQKLTQENLNALIDAA